MLCSRHQIISPGCYQLRWSFPAIGELSPVEARCLGHTERRRRALLRVERELKKGDHRSALSMVKQLQGKPGGLRGFGAAEQVPKRLLTLDDLKLDGRDLSYLEPLVDSVMYSIRRCIWFASMEEEASANATKNIVLEEDLPEEDYSVFALHEAGHFLAGYLLGVLPKEYKLLKKRALGRDQFAGGKVNFIGFDFLREKFNNFSCVILGGIVAEHLSFGYSEGLHSDVDKLDRVIRWLGLTEDEAELHIRWAATNTAFILHRHREAGLKLAEAMASGKPISACIDTIEDAISRNKI
ncbi:hypothetical protein CDL15_Pgr019026 [Punica granatum]|uniref:Peptidase M41 domain-containing protein n=1 Tax=Punica granatum TaxID=22663 RepID=A0A218XM67_PUNGR|nr:hypothetical protein CDL15_Pgr019026 [Punica granatum]